MRTLNNPTSPPIIVGSAGERAALAAGNSTTPIINSTKFIDYDGSIFFWGSTADEWLEVTINQDGSYSGASDSELDRPAAALFGKGTWQVGDAMCITNGITWNGKRLGLVASRCGINVEKLNASLLQLYSRSRHVAEDSISSLKIVFLNCYVTATAPYENVTMQPITYQAQVEDYDGFIIGTVTWNNGESSGVAAGGDEVVSDWCTLTRPLRRGESFFVGQFVQSPSGFPSITGYGGYNPGVDSAALHESGEYCEYAASGLTNRIGTEQYTPFMNKAAHRLHKPAAIIGMTDIPSFALVHDSREGRAGVTVPINGYGHGSSIMTALPRGFPGIQMSTSGSLCSGELAATVARRKLAKYLTHAIFTVGINDFIQSHTVATLTADFKALAAIYKAEGCSIIAATVYPKTNIGNTVPDAPTNTARKEWNTLLRVMPSWIDGVLDYCAIVDPTDSGLYQDTSWCDDGLHLNLVGIRAVVDSGKIPITLKI